MSTSHTYVYLPCQGGHAVFWAGDPDYRIPEGYPCECRKTKVHYKVCETCGHEWMTFVPIDEEAK